MVQMPVVTQKDPFYRPDPLLLNHVETPFLRSGGRLRAIPRHPEDLSDPQWQFVHQPHQW